MKAAHGATEDADHGTTAEASHGATVEADHGTTVKAAHGAMVEADHGTTVEVDHGATVEADHGTTVEAVQRAKAAKTREASKQFFQCRQFVAGGFRRFRNVPPEDWRGY